MENILDKTIDNGVIENVQIAPIGKYTGSSVDGSPVEENITVEHLEKLAERLNNSDEILCDVDHASCKIGADKNSKAAGWFSKWVVDPLKGLFANLSLTKYGRDLLENREYRYTSPVFALDKDGTVADLHSVALTNTPAFCGYISPIINSAPIVQDGEVEEKEIKENLNECLNEETKEILKMEITREELRDMIMSILSEIRAAEKAEEIRREVVEEIVENECAKDGTIKEKEVVEEVVKNETTTAEEVPEEEKKEEIIKIETLNSAPTMKEVEPVWMKLRGKELLDWAAKNPHYRF